MIDLHGKRAVIFGVASEESIAWAVAKALREAGAKICLGYQQRFKSRVLQLQKQGDIDIEYCERCDVSSAQEMDAFFAGIAGPVAILVHSIAYAPQETFAKGLSEVSEMEFVTALTTSAYSLIPLVRRVQPLMSKGGSVMTMSYLGGHRVVANYKLMGVAKAALEAVVRELAAEMGPAGVRVNAISAGPVKTLAASQIPGFAEMLKVYETVTPMRRAITQSDVANLAAFLACDLSRNITAQTMFVDAGYSALAMAELPREQRASVAA